VSGVIIFVCGFVKKLATRILLNTTKPGIVAKSIWGPDNSVRALAGGVHTNNVARHNEAHIGRQFFFLFVGMLLLANSVSAYGLLNTREKDVRFYFEDLKMAAASETIFVGYQPTAFELQALSSYSKGNFQSSLDSSRWRMDLGLYAAAYHEERYPEITQGTPEYPIGRTSFSVGDQGLPLRFGENTWVSAGTRKMLSDWFYIEGQIRGGTSPSDSQNANWYQISKLYAEFRLNSAILSIGRKPMYWSQSRYAGLLLSDSAENFDLIELSTLPVSLPGWFSNLGYFKVESFISRMNAEREPPNSYLFGWRAGWQPFGFFEWSLGLIYKIRGDGAPQAGLNEHFYDFLGMRVKKSVNSQGQEVLNDISDRSGMMDMRLDLGEFSVPLTMYAEHHFEDCCGYLSNVLHSDYTYGFLAKSSMDRSAHRFRVEYSKSSFTYLRHTIWESSISNNSYSAGHPMGRDAQGVYIFYDKEFSDPSYRMGVETFYEERIRTQRVARDYRYARENPQFQESEKRVGLNFSNRLFLSKEDLMELNAGYERIFAREFRRGEDRNAWFALIGMEHRF